MARHTVKTVVGTDVKNPNWVRFLFNDPRTAPLWTVIRVLVGLKWLEIALPKLSNPGWMETGEIVQAWWARGVTIPESGPPPIIYDWYRSFLQALLDAGAYTWMAKLIAVTEVAIGFALVLGAFTGVVALLACFLHWNYLLSGSAGNNGMMFPAAVLLVAAWKVAGYYGLDYFIMRRVSLLWSPRVPDDSPTATAPHTA